MIWKRGPKTTRRVTRCAGCQRLVAVRDTTLYPEGPTCADCERARQLREARRGELGLP